MKPTSKLYLFFTSLMFLLAPLSLGLAAIYFEFNDNKMHIPGLLINIVLLIILLSIIALLIRNKKLVLPNLIDRKFLIFGLLSNVVMYFYVFQNSLSIERYITIYIIIVLILLLYNIIISRKTILYELWIFSVWFFVVDTIHYNFIYDWRYYVANINVNIFQHLLFLSIPIVTLVLFAKAMYKYKVIDVFTKISLVIVLLATVIFMDSIDMGSKYMLTLNLILPFVIITDFITMLIYKRFNILKVPFYLRLYTLMLLMIYYAEEGLFESVTYSNHDVFEMVSITYVALICNIIIFLIPKKNELEEAVSEPVLETEETLLSIDLNILSLTTVRALAKAKGIEDYKSLDKEELINSLK